MLGNILELHELQIARRGARGQQRGNRRNAGAGKDEFLDEILGIARLGKILVGNGNGLNGGDSVIGQT